MPSDFPGNNNTITQLPFTDRANKLQEALKVWAESQGFETGLEMLERFDCPIIVGDIPDALDSQIINQSNIPTPQRLKYGNERIREWADANEKVTLVSIATLMENCKTNEPLSMGELKLVAEGKSHELLQEDRLHLTPRGCSVLGLIMADFICRSFPETDRNGLKTRINEFGKDIDRFYTESGTKLRKAAD